MSYLISVYNQQPPNECEIKGKRVPYDFCSANSLKEAKEFHKNFATYIGFGKRMWHKGTENNYDKRHYFFIKK